MSKNQYRLLSDIVIEGKKGMRIIPKNTVIKEAEIGPKGHIFTDKDLSSMSPQGRIIANRLGTGIRKSTDKKWPHGHIWKLVTYDAINNNDCDTTVNIHIVAAYLDADENNAVKYCSQITGVEFYIIRAAGSNGYYYGEMPVEDPGDAEGGDLKAMEAIVKVQKLMIASDQGAGMESKQFQLTKDIFIEHNGKKVKVGAGSVLKVIKEDQYQSLQDLFDAYVFVNKLGYININGFIKFAKINGINIPNVHGYLDPLVGLNDKKTWYELAQNCKLGKIEELKHDTFYLENSDTVVDMDEEDDPSDHWSLEPGEIPERNETNRRGETEDGL